MINDGYGIYETNKSGELYLKGVNSEDEREIYEIREGCAGISENALTGQHMLKCLKIPASVRFIADGSLSNGGSWAEGEKGLEEVIIDPDNENFYADSYGVFEKTATGRKLLLYLEDNSAKEYETFICSNITDIGSKAFLGRKIYRIRFETNGYSYSFPRHAYFNEELLKSFGKNGKLYDFEEYDRFLLRDHFNADRIRMICERVIQDWEITQDMKERLAAHIKENMSEVIRAAALENAAFELKKMAEAHFFNENNIDGAIDELNRTDRRELLTYLMDYKHENLKTADFDFSI